MPTRSKKKRTRQIIIWALIVLGTLFTYLFLFPVANKIWYLNNRLPEPNLPLADALLKPIRFLMEHNVLGYERIYRCWESDIVGPILNNLISFSTR